MKKARNDNAPKWYIAQCRPSSEHLAGEEILALGQTVYLPTYRREFHNRRQRIWIKRHYPLLPGYLFVLASDHWSRVLDCRHIVKVLRSQIFGEAAVPVGVPDGDVQLIRSAQDAGLFDMLRGSQTGIKPGDAVRVEDGLFKGQKGTIEAIGDDNIVLLINAMCREVRAIIPLESLARVG